RGPPAGAAPPLSAGRAEARGGAGAGGGGSLAPAAPRGFARLITEVGTPDEGGEAPPAATDMDLFLRVCAELGDEILGHAEVLPDESRNRAAKGDDEVDTPQANSDIIQRIERRPS